VAAEKQLHPAEHRAYRELYAGSRQLVRRWRRLAPALHGTVAENALQRGAEQTARLLAELEPRTAAYGLYGKPAAQGLGAGIAELRTGIADRAGDTGMVVRFAVLDLQHLTTLLRQLAVLAGTREDVDLAGFCDDWATALESELGAVREAAVDLGMDPDRAAAPIDDSALSRTAHGAGWLFGYFGEAFDRAVGGRRR
jgi:hypothetical protein